MGPIAPWRIVFWNAEALKPDVASADALARLQLTAKRRGYRILFRHVSRELLALVSFLGLGDVVPTDDFPRPAESNSVQPSNSEV